MYKKHLGHLLTVSLKYFFDFDFSYFHNAYLMVLMLPFVIKLAIEIVGTNLHEGLITVKEDVYTIKNGLITYKQNWDNSELRDNMMSNLRTIRNNLKENNFRTH
ncbi:MAG: hypothetical protein JWQ38_1537 [Flavipsychrobacter sp.]|nr:hypothetical protein [Flavipsychrobacter sp.]